MEFRRVVIATDESPTRRPLLGSVAHHVLHSARCPVLVVVEPEDDIVNAENTG